MKVYELTAHELHEKLVNKELSSVELTNALYERIDEVEAKVNAYVTLDKENALAQAAKVDAKIAAGEKLAPLAGIPGAIKDNISTLGLRTTCSSKMLENFIPIYDAHVIEKLRADETVFLGKTNLDEFAMGSTNATSYFGGVRHPMDLNRVAGGSSGGGNGPELNCTAGEEVTMTLINTNKADCCPDGAISPETQTITAICGESPTWPAGVARATCSTNPNCKLGLYSTLSYTETDPAGIFFWPDTSPTLCNGPQTIYSFWYDDTKTE